jgi:hypothetical protein
VDKWLKAELAEVTHIRNRLSAELSKTKENFYHNEHFHEQVRTELAAL